MHVLRKMAVSLCAALLGVILIAVAWTYIGAATIRDRNVVNGWLDKSNFYNNIADILIQNVEKSTQKVGEQGIPLSDPAVKEVVKNALSGDFVKTTAKTVIDSGYDWFESSDKNLDFTIDFTPIKTQIVDGLSAYAKTRATTLPRCGAVDGNSPVEPLTATCLPRNVTPDQVGSMARDFVLGQDFLKNPVIKGSDIKITKDGKSIPLNEDEKLAAARQAYRLSSFAPLILTVLAALLSVGIVFLSSGRLKGLGRVGNIYLITGLGLAVVYAGLRYFFDWGSKHLANLPGGLNATQKLGIDLARVILNDVERVLLIFTIAYLVIGIGSKVAKKLLKKRGGSDHTPPQKEQAPKEEASKSPDPEERDLTPTEPRPAVPSAPPVPRRPRPPRKIQL